jgi:alpha-L-arabinofuranosidase
MKKIIILLMLLIFADLAFGQSNKLVVDVSNSKAKIQPTMYGIFFEDINFATDGGIYAEMIKNRGFEFEEPMTGWIQPNTNRFSLNEYSGDAEIIKTEGGKSNRNICRVTINNDKGYELLNEGFRGMGIKKNALYRLSLYAAKQSGDIRKIKFSFVNKDGKELGNSSIMSAGKDWSSYRTELKAVDTDVKARLKITFEGTGVIDLDMISIFPEDTWKGRKNGLRKDLGPDYFQSFGLGFFEYFQLAEDIGAEPLPILNCGMACQFNTAELVPLDKLDPYVQDALDLIEFVNGPVSSPWGKVRNDMGHPKPFDMKYIGIGNEQWGKQYIDRYKFFNKALKEKYPEITIVSAVGTFS